MKESSTTRIKVVQSGALLVEKSLVLYFKEGKYFFLDLYKSASTSLLSSSAYEDAYCNGKTLDRIKNVCLLLQEPLHGSRTS